MLSKPYLRLLAMAVLSFIAMYILMYAMVDRLANVFPDLNQAYRAGLMTAPMVIIELLVMRPMHEQNSEIRKLCQTISSGQQTEIDQMKALLQKG